MEIEENLTNGQFPLIPENSGVEKTVYIPAPNDPPWHILESLGVWIASVLFIVILPTIFLLPYLITRNPPLLGSEEMVEFAKSDPTSVLLQIVAILPAHILTLILAWLVVTRLRKYEFRKTLGWNGGGIRMWIAYPAILISFIVVANIVGHFFPEQENDLIRLLRSSRSAVYLIAFVATFTAPIVEEVVYRGILYSAFQRVLGVPAAFLVVTFLFSLVHVPQYYPSYSTIFLLVLLSLTLTAIRVKTKNLLPCIILHTLFNGIQSIGLIVEPLAKSPEIPAPAALILHLFK